MYKLICLFLLIGCSRTEYPRHLNDGEIMRFARWFPRLHNSLVLAPATISYNCFGYSLDQVNPKPISSNDIEQLYINNGFIRTSVSNKIGTVALYYLNKHPVHAAILTTNGWESKLGRGIRIRHNLYDLEGPIYGKVGAFYIKE